MREIFLIISMVFFHIVDDYYLQGLLASLKQKSWWEKNAPDKIYEYDYIMALIMHSLSWSFMIMLPLAIYSGFTISLAYVVMFVINTIAHAIIDNLKANLKKINLIQDQLIHIGQIFITFIAYMESV